MQKIIKKLHLSKTSLCRKNFIVLYIMILLAFSFLIVGIILMGIEHSNYLDFVSNHVEPTKHTPPDISAFIYGIFFLLLAIILIFGILLYGYNVKKLLELAKQPNN